MSVINSILENTDNGRIERAKILTGAYGRGKSHIVLVSLAVLYNKDSDKFKKLIKKIRKLDSESAQRMKTTYPVKKDAACYYQRKQWQSFSFVFTKHYSRHCIIMN